MKRLLCRLFGHVRVGVDLHNDIVIYPRCRRCKAEDPIARRVRDTFPRCLPR